MPRKISPEERQQQILRMANSYKKPPPDNGTPVNYDRPPGSPPQVFGYGRMSKADQKDSPEVQRSAVNARAKAMGLPEPLFFLDAATSGATTLSDRTAGKELCARLRSGDIVIIAKLDRAFRSLRDCANQLHIWTRLGVSVQLCDLGFAIDLSTPWGKAMVNMIGVFAELERDMLSLRTKEGLGYIKRLGHRNTGIAPYGYKWVPKYSKERGRMVMVKVPDPEKMAFLRWILHAREELNMTWDQMYRHMAYKGGPRTKNQKKEVVDIGPYTFGRMYRRACKLREEGVL